MESHLVCRNLTVMGRRTSVRLEPENWIALEEISKREGCTQHDIASLIALKKKSNISLTSAIRVFITLYYRSATDYVYSGPRYKDMDWCGHPSTSDGCISEKIEAVLSQFKKETSFKS